MYDCQWWIECTTQNSNEELLVQSEIQGIKWSKSLPVTSVIAWLVRCAFSPQTRADVRREEEEILGILGVELGKEKHWSFILSTQGQ